MPFSNTTDGSMNIALPFEHYEQSAYMYEAIFHGYPKFLHDHGKC